jgi:PAS domain S-box-containing protein
VSTLSASIGRRSLQLGRAQAVPYGFAILIPLIATGLTFGIDRAVDGDTGFGIYFIAVAIVGWRGGLRPAAVATTICSIAEATWLLSPSGPGALHLIRLVLFVAACAVASVLTDRLRVAQQRAGERGQLAREREERLELTLEASQTGVWDWDVRADSLTWSARFAELHGLRAGDSTSVRMIDVLASVVDEDREAVAGAVQRSVESGNPYDVEYRVTASDGSLRWLNTTGRTTAWVNGRPTRMVGIVRNVTTWRDAEADRDRLLAAERQVQRIRDAFIEVLSHELRTPMTTIIGGAELLERGRLSADRVLEVAHDVREEAERMIRLIEDLLVLSRAERGSLEISDEPVLVQRVVDRVTQDIRRRQPSLMIDLALAADLPPVRAELTYVEQVLRNLVGNAAKYGPASGPIRITGAVVDGSVEIRVLDAGPGIGEDDLERVFELFYRSRETASRVSGAGIGLFVCRQLVELMGGRIWCRPRPAGGSEFGFNLPLELGDGLG